MSPILESTGAASQEPGVLSIGKVDTPAQFAQAVVGVMDFSGSMADRAAGNVTKAEAVGFAVRELLTRMKASKVRQNFSFGYLTFDAGARVRQPLTPMASADDNANYNFLAEHGGGTRIYEALEQVERLLAGYFGQVPADGVPHSAVVLLMSDGCCENSRKTREVADRIKATHGSRVTLACCLFATVGDVDADGQQLLRDVSSDPNRYYKTVYDAETLRGFFAATVSSASGGVRVS